MRDHDDLTSRLDDLGSTPVPADIRDGHLHAMRTADVAPTSERRRFGRLAVAGAAIVGFAVGSTGFAMAGALPGPAQGVAHDVLSVVQVEIPDEGGSNSNGIGSCMSQAAKTEDPVAKKAAQDACKAEKGKGRPADDGTPGRSGEAPGQQGKAKGRPAEAGPHPNEDLNDCKGKPAWAGKKGGPSEEQRAAREACPDDDATDAAEDEAERQREAEEERLEQEQEAAEEQAEEGEQGVDAEHQGPREDVPADPATPPADPGDGAAEPATPPADPGAGLAPVDPPAGH